MGTMPAFLFKLYVQAEYKFYMITSGREVARGHQSEHVIPKNASPVTVNHF
jgi:hypothetical protein